MPIETAKPMSDDEFKTATDRINKKYEADYDKLKKEGEDLEKDADNCIAEVGLDVEWGLTSIKFDIPEIKLKMHEMKFHFVKTYFRTKTIAKLDVPKFRWDITRIGPIKTKIPKWYTKRIEVKTKIPEFKWDVTSIKTKIPEFYSKRVEIKFHILKILNLKELNVPCKTAKDKGDEISAAFDRLAIAHQNKIYDATHPYLLDKAEEIEREIDNANTVFDQALSEIDEAVAEVRKNNIDPSTIKTAIDDKEVSLLDAKASVELKRNEAINQLMDSHAKVLIAVKELQKS